MSPSRVSAASITFTIISTAALFAANPTTNAFYVGPPQPLFPQQQQLYHQPSWLHYYYPISFHHLSNPLLRRELYWCWPGGGAGGRRAFQKMTATASDEDLEKEISSMKVAQIRRELESYGISTKSFFEKSELVEALVAARKEGKAPVVAAGDAGGAGRGAGEDASPAEDASSSTSSSSPSGGTSPPSSSSSSNTAASSTSDASSNRRDRIQREIDKCNKLKIGELKKELESYGVSTKSYFEKSEFVRAVAEARVDGPPKKRETTTASSSSGGSKASGRVRDEPRDPTYRDVIVTKFPGNKSLLEGKIIEIRSR